MHVWLYTKILLNFRYVSRIFLNKADNKYLPREMPNFELRFPI